MYVEQLKRENQEIKTRFEELLNALNASLEKDSKPSVVQNLQQCLQVESGKSMTMQEETTSSGTELATMLNEFMYNEQ